MAVYLWFCDVTGSASFKVVREALDVAWSPGNAEKAGQPSVAELVPGDEEGELTLGSAVAQNAVACVAYALQVRQTGTAEPALWAARQLYEAGDAVVQQGAAVHTYAEDIDHEPPVQLMVRGIHAALDSATSPSPAGLLAAARADGETFLGFVVAAADSTAE
jgi:hypothetical protein